MEQNLKDILGLYLTSMSCYAFYLCGFSIIKETKKLIKKLIFLRACKTFKNDIEGLMNKAHNEYVILEGAAKKIYPRHGSYIDKKVIVSEGNTTYYEDFFFFLESDKIKPRVIVQPYPNTRLSSLTTKFLTESKSIWDKLAKKILYAKSQTINDGDRLFIFGKINKNKKDIITEFHHLINIKPKEITAKSVANLKYLIKERHLSQVYFQSLILVLLGISIYYQIKFFVFPKFKRMFYTVRYRTRVDCKECNQKACNVLCEKCLNLSEYCDQCYIGLQDKINSEIIKLEDIKCYFCKGVLDSCQKLLSSNS